MSLAEIHHSLSIIIPHSYPERPYRVFLSDFTYFTIENPPSQLHTLSLFCTPLRLYLISHRNGPFPLRPHPHWAHISAPTVHLSEPPLISLSKFSPRSAHTSLLTLPPLLLQSHPLLSFSFFLLRKILCICLRPRFLAALLGTIPLHPSTFLPLPLYLFPFFSFHLRRLRAYLIRISFLRSMWLFCYSRQLTIYIYI